MPELKPCPFCGKKAKHYIRATRGKQVGGITLDGIEAVICCPNCKIEIKQHMPFEPSIEDFEEFNKKVIETWNRRS